MIDIRQDPPSKRFIRNKQNEMTPGQVVTLWCPIPVVDIAAGLATDLIHGDEKAAWRDVPGAARRDWSSDSVAQSYVDKVRAGGRELVSCEVSALKANASTAGTVSGVLEDVGAVFLKHFKGA